MAIYHLKMTASQVGVSASHVITDCRRLETQTLACPLVTKLLLRMS